jgi:hypothetical protein
VVVQAVCIEPVSGDLFPASGKNTGKTQEISRAQGLLTSKSHVQTKPFELLSVSDRTGKNSAITGKHCMRGHSEQRLLSYLEIAAQIECWLTAEVQHAANKRVARPDALLDRS